MGRTVERHRNNRAPGSFAWAGRKDGLEDTNPCAGVLPTLDMYEAIDRLHKPVIAGGNHASTERPVDSGRRCY